MLNHVLVALVAAVPLIGAAVQSCHGDTVLQQVEGVEPNTAVAALPAPHVPDDVEAVRALRDAATRFLAGTPEERLLPQTVVAAFARPDGSLSLQFPPGPPPSDLHMVFLVHPEDALDHPPVWYNEETERISYCRDCARSEPFSSETLGLLYARALFDQATVGTVKTQAADLRQQMEGALLMLGAANRASDGRLIPRLTAVLAHPALSDAVVPGSPWRIPSDSGWTHVDFVWPWNVQSGAEMDVVDDLVHLSCALLQGRTQKERQQAFRTILTYTLQGC